MHCRSSRRTFRCFTGRRGRIESNRPALFACDADATDHLLRATHAHATLDVRMGAGLSGGAPAASTRRAQEIVSMLRSYAEPVHAELAAAELLRNPDRSPGNAAACPLVSGALRVVSRVACFEPPPPRAVDA
jgi:hypothetical protein